MNWERLWAKKSEKKMVDKIKMAEVIFMKWEARWMTVSHGAKKLSESSSGKQDITILSLWNGLVLRSKKVLFIKFGRKDTKIIWGLCSNATQHADWAAQYNQSVKNCSLFTIQLLTEFLPALY